MTNNDTSTLNGALQELGETMAENLTTMGVPSTYDEGLTTLAGKILEIAPVPPTPTPASVTLTGTKSILSYADSEQSVLTATVLDSNDDPVENASVDLYKDGNLWDTLSSDAAGQVSKTYVSAGSGDISFEAKVGSLVSETFSIRDVHYYADYSKVKSTWTVNTSVSGRTIYNYLNAVTDTTVEFKFNNLPTNFLVGIGKFYNSGQIKSMMFNNNGTKEHWYSTDSRDNNSRNISQTITSNTVFKFSITNTNTISFYIDDVLVATDNCKTSFSNYLRIDDFTSTPLDLDYVIIQ